jgi:hypothetical protein
MGSEQTRTHTNPGLGRRASTLIHLINGLAVAICRLGDAAGLLRVGLGHGRAPAELVLDLSELDALELSEQLDANGTGVLLAGGDVGDLFQLALGRQARVLLDGRADGYRVGGVKAPRDGANGDQCSGGSCCHDFGELRELRIFDLCLMVNSDMFHYHFI